MVDSLEIQLRIPLMKRFFFLSMGKIRVFTTRKIWVFTTAQPFPKYMLTVRVVDYLGFFKFPFFS